MTLIVIFLATVKWTADPQPSKAFQAPPPDLSIIFLIDSSQSMFPAVGPTYFDLARDGIAAFLQRPGFPTSGGRYEISVLQYAKMGSPGYDEGIHWIGPTQIETEADWTVLLQSVQHLERTGHQSGMLIDVGIAEATAILDASTAVDRHIMLLSTGEYRTPVPAPQPCYVTDASGECPTHCDNWTGSETLSYSTENPNPIPSVNRACNARFFAGAAHGKGYRLSTLRLGSDWRNLHHVDTQGGDVDPYAELPFPYGQSPNHCPAILTDLPDQPDRGGFLIELATCCSDAAGAGVLCGPSVVGRHARIDPFYCFTCGIEDFRPGTAGDVSGQLAAWLCAWENGQPDADLDGYADLCDNCPYVCNPRQRDCDQNGVGDICQFYEVGTTPIACTAWENPNPPPCGDQTDDTDCDGIPNAADQCPSGDDCLVSGWLSDADCAPGTPLGDCGCDCDHDSYADPCQAAIEIQGETLPSPPTTSWADIDVDRTGVADCCEQGSCVCDAIPTVCDRTNTGATTQVFETIPAGTAFGLDPNAPTDLESLGWWLSDATAIGSAQIIDDPDDPARRILKLSHSQSSEGPWFIEGPGFQLPPPACLTQPDSQCLDPGPWGVVAYDLELLYDPTNGGSEYDIYIVDPCTDSTEDSVRVHFRLVPHPTDSARGVLLMESLSVNAHCSFSPDFPGYLELARVSAPTDPNLPVDEWFTITVIFNSARNLRLEDGTCSPQPGAQSTVSIEIQGAAIDGDCFLNSENHFDELGLSRQPEPRGLQLVVESKNACDCRYDTTVTGENWPPALHCPSSVPMDCHECSAVDGWKTWLADHCPPGTSNVSCDRNNNTNQFPECPIVPCQDNCPAFFNEWQTDTDGDGWGDRCDVFGIGDDFDRDNIVAPWDNCYEIANPIQLYTTTQSRGNCGELVFGLRPNVDFWQPDRDCDGIGDPCDLDASSPCTCSATVDEDGDGCGDTCDNCPSEVNDQRDYDQDGIGDACDNCPYVANSDTKGICVEGKDAPTFCNIDGACDSTPGNGTGKCEFGQTDADNDGVGDVCDNCRSNWNPDQLDYDRNGIGDACDSNLDDDGDGTPNDVDPCPYFFDPCNGNMTLSNADYDADGVSNVKDNCPSVPNVPQADRDCDGLGDACDTTTELTDADGDGLANGCDNCPYAANISQDDTDNDGVGNACDNCCQRGNADQVDLDRDGVGDACDPDPADPANGIIVGSYYECPECETTPGPLDAMGMEDNCSVANGILDMCEPDCDGDLIPNCQDPLNECDSACLDCQSAAPVRRFAGRPGDPCPDGPTGLCAVPVAETCFDSLWIRSVVVRETDLCEWNTGVDTPNCSSIGETCICSDTDNNKWSCYP